MAAFSPASIAFLPFLQAASPPTPAFCSLAILAPILVSAHANVPLAQLPLHAEKYLLDDFPPSLPVPSRLQRILALLDSGFSCVVSDLYHQLILAGLPPHRIIFAPSLSVPSLPDGLPAPPGCFLSHPAQRPPSFHGPCFIHASDSCPLARTFDTPVLDIPVIPASSPLLTNLEDFLARFFVPSLRPLPSDGLFPTSVASLFPPSTLLGQVFSNASSIISSVVSAQATYFSRSRNQLWTKGATSGATQRVIRIRTDCDRDAIEFVVSQKPGTGFCHTQQLSCFGPLGGLSALQATLIERRNQLSTPNGSPAPQESYTHRLLKDEMLLKAKILEEAQELCDAESKQDVAAEMADLMYFAMCRCISKGVSLADVEHVLDQRALKVTRRKGDAKPEWADRVAQAAGQTATVPVNTASSSAQPATAPSPPAHACPPALRCRVVDFGAITPSEQSQWFKRPIADSETMVALVRPILDMVKFAGDQGLTEAVAKFDRYSAGAGRDLVLNAPFSEQVTKLLSADVKRAIDQAYENIYAFHLKQLDKENHPIVLETMKGVVCSRFARPIDRVGLYVPGGTAVLPSTALMLAIPAQVAGCGFVSIATPPRPEGSISPEIIYIASKCGVKQIVKAGGAQGIAALAYGTESVAKVDKVFGPGNQFVTTAKMIVAGELGAQVSIDMPAGPSEVMVIADEGCKPSFVAADLLSQAEHGKDSQVILVAVDLSEEKLAEVQHEIEKQGSCLPRVEIVKESIGKHGLVIRVDTVEKAFEVSNSYGPEHLILHLRDCPGGAPTGGQGTGADGKVSDQGWLEMVRNAGSVFVGEYSPESCGDYCSGTNHSLPTAGYAKMYSGVSTASFMKHITSQRLSKDGLRRISRSVMDLAKVEGLVGHLRAVEVRLEEGGHTDRGDE